MERNGDESRAEKACQGNVGGNVLITLKILYTDKLAASPRRVIIKGDNW